CQKNLALIFVLFSLLPTTPFIRSPVSIPSTTPHSPVYSSLTFLIDFNHILFWDCLVQASSPTLGSIAGPICSSFHSRLFIS
ncbi:hypothetical protein L2E82_38485, partial [Cichorium intybus]